MLADILRFNRQAQENLRLAQKNHWTLSELVRHRRHGLAFQKWYLLPMSGAIWSMSYEKALRFPAETFLTFCLNHHLLQVNHRPVWRTIDGGSINYVNQVRDRLDNIHLGSQVQSLRQDPHQTDQLLLSVNSSEVKFDKVVLATHGPVSRQIVQAAFPELAVVLTPLQVSRNRVDLHQDSSVMPRKKICWSSWNVSARESITDQREIDLTYYLNKLQPLNSERDHFITLNSHKELSAIDQTFIYDHPQFDFAAIRTQERLPEIQGRHGIYLAGAWTRYGFHEDGILSAVTAARLLGSEPPWM
jgi:predicted NAD/FAD-binding protein